MPVRMETLVGQPLVRKEDRRLLTGLGQFLDDISLPEMLHMAVFRSPYAHARLRALNADAARHAPGVVAVLTGEDLLRDGIGPIPVKFQLPRWDGTPEASTAMQAPPYPALPLDEACYAGQPLAIVIAGTVQQAVEAAERIGVEADELPATTCPAAALDDGAVAVWSGTGSNLCFDWRMGDSEAVGRAFARAAHIARLRLVNNRVIPCSMETRGAVGQYDPASGKYTLFTGSQTPHSLQQMLSKSVFDVGQSRIRVVVRDVGGGFGSKNPLYPEQILVLWAAHRLGRPVKWISSRAEAFLSDTHGRDNVTDAELALDADGRFIALNVSNIANLGAYMSSSGASSPVTNIKALVGPYGIPTAAVRVRGVFTNTTPTDVYRGAGRPEAVYVIERVVDAAAHDLGLDPAELRRRNLIPRAEMPFRSALGLVYDEGDFERRLDEALDKADWAGFEARREHFRRQGKARGIGLATYVERCGAGVDHEDVELRFDPSGSVTVLSGSMSNGQGHETALAQYLAASLGLGIDRVAVVQGDTDIVASGNGTGGSRSVPLGAAALRSAAEKVVCKGKLIAAHMLEASPADIAFHGGTYGIVGTDRGLAMADVVKASFSLSPEVCGFDPRLDETGSFQPQNFTFPNGCHVAEVEIDVETGAVSLVRYTAVHDFGTVLNPHLLEGQLHGGLAQGIGQALHERVAYSGIGQLETGSFADYCIPRARDLPAFEFVSSPTGCPSNPTGIKGAGEAGSAGAPPAVINAVVDALKPFGVRHVDMPATSERIWTLMKGAR